MLSNAQEKTLVSGSNATQRAYTVEEVFEHIAYELKSPDTAIDYRFGLLEKNKFHKK